MADEHELAEKENLFLADAAALLAQRPGTETRSPGTRSPELRSPKRGEEDEKDLRRRQQSVSFLAWQKGQLTQNLRRRSEQTLVAAADLRELTAVVRREASAAADEEIDLSRAEEELAAARTQCLLDIQKIWDALDERERRLEQEAEEVLAEAAEAQRNADALIVAGNLSKAVCDQAGDLQEESALLVDLHEDLETRDVSLQCQEAAFGCLVTADCASAEEREATLAALREGVANELALALGKANQEAPAAIKEAILSVIVPCWGIEREGNQRPEPPRVKVDPRIFSRPSSLAMQSGARPEVDYDYDDAEDDREADYDWDGAEAKEPVLGDPDDLSPGNDWTGEDGPPEEGQWEGDFSPEGDWDGEDLQDAEDEEGEEELDHEEDFEMASPEAGSLHQSPVSASGPADSPNSALPSDSTFIGFPVPALAEAPAISPSSVQVTRSSFPVATALTPQRLTFAPMAAQSQPAPFPVPVWAQTTTMRPRAQVVAQPGTASVPVQFMRLAPQ